MNRNMEVVSLRKTSLEWDLDSPVVKGFRDPTRKSNWIFGDQKKLKEAISYFLENTSIHGVQFIWSKDRKLSRVKQIFLIVFFVTCVLMMLGSVILLLQDSLTTESVYITITDKDTENGINEDIHFPRHPKIYICRRPSYRTDVNTSYRELLEYAYLSLGFPYVSLTPNEISLLLGIIMNRSQGKQRNSEIKAYEKKFKQLSMRFKQIEENTENFNLTHFLFENSIKCEDVFIACHFFLFPMECCKVFKPILTNFGLCFSFELGDDDFKIMMQNKELTYFLLFDMHAAPRIQDNHLFKAKPVDMGYEIFLMDPRYKDGSFTAAGHYTLNGHELIMNARLVKTSRKAFYTPWHGFSTNCPQLEPDLDPFGHGERYFLASCIKSYANLIAREKCGCKLITDERIFASVRIPLLPTVLSEQPNIMVADTPLKECDVEKQLCIDRIALADNLTKVSEACKHPCVEYHYEINTNLLKIGNNNISRFFLNYDRNQYSLEEYKRTTLSSSLSQIGGATGLYIGASIISALEVILLLISCLWYRFLPHKRDPNTTEMKKKKKKLFHNH